MKILLQKIIGIASIITTSTVFAGELTIPNTFSSGTAAVAAEVNANFTAVETEVDDNATAITTKQNLVTSTCPAGQSIRAIAANGTVTCETDDVGSGDITAVNSGSGLTGGGSSGSVTLSVPTSGITAAHIAPAAVGSSEVADNTLTAADTIDEPGVDFTTSATFGSSINIATTWTSVHTKTITAPASGYVTCIATGFINLADYTAYTQSITIGWDHNNNTVGTAPSAYIWYTSGVQPITNNLTPYTAMATFTVNTGANNFYLKADTTSSDATDYDMWLTSTACMFFPTRY